MLSKLIFRQRNPWIYQKIIRPQLFNTRLTYMRTAQFGLLEDKFKEIREQAFNRTKTSKTGEEPVENKSKNLMNRFKLFSEKSSGTQDYFVSSLNLDQTIDRLKMALEQEEKSHNLYYKILERFQEIVIDEPETTGKTEILRILRAMNYYQPKEEERLARQGKKAGYVHKQQDFISKRHLQEIKKNAYASATPLSVATDYMRDGLKLNYLKDIVKDWNPSEREVTSKDIYDVIEIYKTLFRNIELIIHEELNRKNIDHQEILDILVSFSIAGEASNTFLERILEIIYPNLLDGNYTMHEIELIINYFPQELWNHSPAHEKKANEFNTIIAAVITDKVDEFSNREMLSFFQAFSNTPQFPKMLLNKMLNKFVNLLENDKMTKVELINFLEIYAIMIRDKPNQSAELDSTLLMSFASNAILRMHKAGKYTFNFHEISELFWVFGALDIFNNAENRDIVKPLEEILNHLLAEYIAKYKPLTEADRYEGMQQKLPFDEDDAETIMFYYQNYGDRGVLSNTKQVMQTLKSICKKYDDRPERERKWFVF